MVKEIILMGKMSICALADQFYLYKTYCMNQVHSTSWCVDEGGARRRGEEGA